MAFLIAELLVALLVAALLGVLVGWLFTAVRWRRRIEQLEEGWNSKLQLAERQTERMDSQLQTAVRERDKAGAAYREAEGELADLRSQLTASTSKLAGIEVRQHDLSTALAAQDDTSTSLREELTASRVELQRREQELARLTEDLRQSNTRLADPSELEERLRLYQRQLGDMEELRENLAALREQMAAQEEERASALREKDAELTELQDELRIITEREQGREERLRIATTAEAQMRTELSRLTRQISALTTERDSIEAELGAEQQAFTVAAPAAEEADPPHAPPRHAADDLKKIAGIGPKLERMLNEHGVYRYRDIAAWGEGEIEHFSKLRGEFRGRIERDNWIEQATALSNASQARDK
jgi:predicted flap endonuclease-1-like 5' DNA nuclease/uncharacterized coiled-coil protein SlyX